MRIRTLVAAALLSTGLFACADEAVPPAHAAVSADAKTLQAHLEFLASDALEGRDTGSRGHEIAAQYIVSKFKALGLQPAGDDGTYYQRIKFRRSSLKEGSASFVVDTGSEQVELEFGKEFLTGPSAYAEQSEVTAPVVFVGYGLVSEEFGLNDYANVDVDGKVVMMLSGRPAELPSEEGAHLNSSKTRFAAERGAVGVITLHTLKTGRSSPV